MGTNTTSLGWARWMAAAIVTGGLAIAGAAASQAAGLPAPPSPSMLPAAPAPLNTVLTTALPSLLTGVAAPSSLPGVTLPAPPSGLPSLPALPGPSAPAGSASAGSTGSSTTGSAHTTSTSGSTTSGSTTGTSGTGSPGGIRATTPVASLCLIPTGTSSPAFNLGLSAVGQDLSSPLVQHFPQAFAPCPATAASAPDQLAAVDASLNGLVGACVRVTRQVVPIQTTLVVLNHNLIQELTAAGVPLQQLVVPCPAGAGGAGASAGQASGTTVANSALAGDDLGNPAGQGRLAFTGIDLIPSLALAGALLWGGTLLLRASRRLSVRPALRG